MKGVVLQHVACGVRGRSVGRWPHQDSACVQACGYGSASFDDVKSPNDAFGCT